MLTFDKQKFSYNLLLLSLFFPCTIVSHRRNELEFHLPLVSGSLSPTWIVLVAMNLELIQFILHIIFFQSRSLSLEALKKYTLLLITFTCSEGILLSVKQPSSQKDFFVPASQ